MKFNQPLRNYMLVAAAMVALATTACKKDDDQPVLKNITETVVNDPQLTLLEAAVVKAGLANTLATTANLTVFAPNDAAFKKLDINGDGTPDLDTEAKIKALDAEGVALLTAVLQYHVLTSTVKAADVPAGPNAAITTLGGKQAFATRNSSGVYINGVKVVKADVAATNGVIHVIDRVLLPPAGNIVQTAAAAPNFTYLVAAVQRAGSDIINALTGPGPLTVFAPTNQAFINAGFPTIASIQVADPNALKPILLYHVVAARVFSSDLTEGAQPTTAGGGKLTITLSGGAKVKGTGNMEASNIITTDIVTTNGVVHVIDRVLLP
ncbi:fasciclin domain-containing protein [Paraflavitalea sp. CAU 1676]|uniref:fasciclin domain-containing protein n=1 Tax=Paraflavitalea sp. CAU 1676 TaxID=3032598 RepID=UPI0023D9B554|nr:fasciclin domain-containing protein [Paraflavitalea sp. CAU 1676]MDF2192135.1 fasciclin domain-containing protein [Paraflavitalea sp. CAU 1676]